MKQMRVYISGLKQLLLVGILHSLSSQLLAASSSDLINLHVNKEGIHRITLQQLNVAGLDLSGVKWKNIALKSQGESVPIRYVDSDSPAIEFLGKPRQSLYGEEMIYTLSIDRKNHRAVKNDKTKVKQSQESSAFFMSTRYYEPQLRFTTSAPGDPWYSGKFLYTGPLESVDLAVEIDHYVPGVETVEVSAGVWGFSSFANSKMDHHLRLFLNDVQLTGLGETPDLEQFSGRVEHEIIGYTDVEGNGTALFNGENNITLRLVVDEETPLDVMGVDNWGITYPRAYVASDGRLTFTSDAQKFTVSGVNSSDLVVYRQDDNGSIHRLSKLLIQGDCVTSGPQKYRLGECRVSFSGTGNKATYYVSEAENVYSVVSLKPVPELADITSGQAEYLILANSDFLGDTLDDFAAYRGSEYSVKIVDVEQVYAQFGHYLFGSEGIANYIKYAHRSMGLKHVLLVGGDTIDYTNNYNYENPSISFVPTLYGDTGLQMFAPLDAKYADIDDDNVPDVALGRLPVRTIEELQVAVHKIYLYEDINKPHARTALFASDMDDPDSGYSFEADAEALIDKLPDSWMVNNPEKAYIVSDGLSTARSKLLAGLDQGYDLVSYVGHSDASYWGYLGVTSSFLTINDLTKMNNNGRPTLVTQWGCWNTFFPMPRENTMAHRFMLQPAENGEISNAPGAVGVVGAATVTEAEAEAELSQILFSILFQQDVTLGEAITLAKQQYAITRPEQLDVILGWTTLADPALKISR